MLQPCAGFIFNNGNNIKPHFYIQVVLIHKMIYSLNQLIDLFLLHKILRIPKIGRAAGLYFHYREDIVLSGYNVNFGLLVDEVSRNQLITHRQKMSCCHLLPAFTQFVVLRHAVVISSTGP